MGRPARDIKELQKEWSRVGGELLEVDPGRFLALLEIAQRVLMAHRDPMSASTDEIVMAQSFGGTSGSA